MGNRKYIIGYLSLILLFYSLFLFFQGAASATFDGFGDAGMTVYSDAGQKWLDIIGYSYLIVFITLFLIFLLSLRRDQVKWYGVKTCIIFIVSFIIGFIIVPYVFLAITSPAIKKIATYIREAGMTTCAIPY